MFGGRFDDSIPAIEDSVAYCLGAKISIDDVDSRFVQFQLVRIMHLPEAFNFNSRSRLPLDLNASRKWLAPQYVAAVRERFDRHK